MSLNQLNRGRKKTNKIISNFLMPFKLVLNEFHFVLIRFLFVKTRLDASKLVKIRLKRRSVSLGYTRAKETTPQMMYVY